MMVAFKFLRDLFCLVTCACFTQATGNGQEHCYYPRVVCGEDACMPPGKICDGRAECGDNTDEEPGICNHYGVCLGQCLREADSPTDRWSTVSCSICCLMDLDGDNALTLEEMIEAQIMFCGSDEQDCRSNVLAAISTNNGIALCGNEAEDVTVFLSGLASDQGQDLPAATFSRNDMRAKWFEFAQGVNPPDGKVPMSRCMNFYDKKVRMYAYDTSCANNASPSGPAVKFGPP